MTTTSDNLYYWNSYGAIVCEKCAPDGASDIWEAEMWRQFTDDDHARMAARDCATIICEKCKAVRS